VRSLDTQGVEHGDSHRLPYRRGCRWFRRRRSEPPRTWTTVRRRCCRSARHAAPATNIAPVLVIIDARLPRPLTKSASDRPPPERLVVDLAVPIRRSGHAATVSPRHEFHGREQRRYFGRRDRDARSSVPRKTVKVRVSVAVLNASWRPRQIRGECRRHDTVPFGDAGSRGRPSTLPPTNEQAVACGGRTGCPRNFAGNFRRG
jgi:hypothetical protein